MRLREFGRVWQSLAGGCTQFGRVSESLGMAPPGGGTWEKRLTGGEETWERRGGGCDNTPEGPRETSQVG